MTAAGSVSSPSRLSNEAVKTFPLPGGGERGDVVTRYGAVSFDTPEPLGAHPFDTGAEPDIYYRVRKQFRYANTAGITHGQIPVPYDQVLSRPLGSSGPPSEPLSYDTKTYDNASYRRTFGSFAQRYPSESAPPGEGMWRVDNPYYPNNLPSQISQQPPPGVGRFQRGQSGVVSPFVVIGGRGMTSPYADRQTRLAAPISYSSTTQMLGGSVFNEGALGG